MAVHVLDAHLVAEHEHEPEAGSSTAPVVAVVARHDGHRRAVVRFRPDRHRVRSELPVPGRRHGVDISFQPATVARLLTDTAAGQGDDGRRWCAALTMHLVELRPELAVVVGERRDPVEWLVAVAGAQAHPSLVTAYAAGARPLAEIPRWSRTVFEAATFADGVRARFAGKSTRALVRALAARTMVDGLIDPMPLARAMLVEPFANSGEVVLAADAVGVVRAPSDWPSGEDLDLAWELLPTLGRRRAVDLVVESASHPDPRALFEVLRLVAATRDLRDGRPLRGSLEQVRDQCAAVAPHLPPPPLVREELPPEPDRQRRPRQGGAPADGAAAPAASAAAGRRPTTTPQYVYEPPLSMVHHLGIGSVQLVLPADPAELRAWSARLDNCLDTYPGSVRAGTAWIIGVRYEGHLFAAIEIDPLRRRVVQFLGRSNRPVPVWMSDEVRAALGDVGVIRRPVPRRHR